MDRTELIRYCLAKRSAVEDYPFGESELVVKVGGRIFAMIPLEAESAQVNLKCDPDLVPELRARYRGSVTTAAYLSHRHWNRLRLDGTVPDDEVRELVDLSYDLVVAKLTRRQREALR
jgi:predicted DNA-binding protein (MmcQ/YjbR family)